jgi:hypothetical protein
MLGFVDVRKLGTAERVVALTAIIALVALFLPWYGVSVSALSVSVIGVDSGYGWLGGMLIGLAGAYLVLLRSGTTMPPTKLGPGVLVLGASLIGTVIVALRWISIPRVSDAVGISVGPRYGLVLTLVAGIAQVLFALLLFRRSGESVPWAK